MQNMDLAEQVRHIKRSLRGVMNGPVSASMREKGLTYKVNFGVELPRLQQMSKEMPHTYELAARLWKEDIRECRLLAGMLMPAADFQADMAEVWVEQMRFAEEAECSVMHLFCHTDWASQKAFEWIAAEEPMKQLCGYLMLARLFMKGAVPNERDAQEYLDQTRVALVEGNTQVRLAASKALYKFMDLGTEQEKAGDELLNSL